ncbi:hypothetical protein ACFWDN_21135 [Micromonospora chalcea]
MATDSRDALAELVAEEAERYGLDPDDLRARVLRQLARRTSRAALPLKGCPACLRDLPARAFAEDASKADGLKAVCRECDAVRVRLRRASPCPGA